MIWDLEGVLLLTRGGDVEVGVARRLGLQPEDVRAFFHGEFNDRTDLGEFQQRDFWHHILDNLGLPREKVTALDDFLYEDTYIDRELLEIVREYRKQYKTAMLSNYSEMLRPMLETYWRVDGAFDEIIISCEVKMIKPDPGIFELTLARMGCLPEETVFIDDRIKNIEGAQKFGMHTVHYQNRQQSLYDLEQILSRESLPLHTRQLQAGEYKARDFITGKEKYR